MRRNRGFYEKIRDTGCSDRTINCAGSALSRKASSWTLN